ncbi:MAG: DUF1326 domain-containing protein [Gammaproteobacteria bacterium]|nr:DUF1326 domain-containing protein [Gammaproteobacteria bacterium]
MTDTPWRIEGKMLEYCSCDFGCPCESQVPPSRGHCDGVFGITIDKGHFGDVDLSGLKIVATFFFPRAIHHGGGHMQPIFDEHSSEDQRNALFTIMGGEGQPVGTIFQVFSVIVEHHHDPVFAKIDFEWDKEKRTARINIPGVAQATTVPIRNPVTDEEHHIRLVLPEGWMFYEAEGASGTAKGIGDIKFDFSQRHSSLAYYAWDNNGMAETFEEFKQSSAAA